MRALTARRTASSVLCATLLLGVAAPAAFAADIERDRARVTAPAPGSDVVMGQAQALGDVGAVVTEVTKLVDAAVKADNGQLSATRVDRLGRAAKAAIEKAAVAAPRAQAASTSPTSVQPLAAHNAAQAPVDLGPLLDALLGGVAGVVQAVASTGGNVLTEVTNLLNGLVSYVASAASNLGGALPVLPTGQSA
jgi:hypothetical protein